LPFWGYRRWREEIPAGDEQGSEREPGDEIVLEDELVIEKTGILQAKIDPERFDTLFELYYERIFRFHYHRTRHRDEAEDLTSETFRRALRAMGRFRWQGVSFGAWIYRIALNELRRWHAGRKKRNEVRMPENLLGEEVLASRDPDPAQALDRALDRERLMGALAELSEDDQDILALHYFEGLTVPQVAVILDKPRGTVSARVTRALERLRRALEIGTGR